MIKHLIRFSLALTTVSALAQSQPYPATSGATAAQSPGNPNQIETGTGTFRNQTGQNFSVDQLANQLQNLRTAVEQSLPTLEAFNQTYSNSAPGGIGGTVSGLLSRALNRNEQTNTAPPKQSSLTISNLVGALSNLLNTNRTGQGSVPQNTVNDLIALQNSLQPVVSILDRLNVSSLSTNQLGTPYNRLTPTGR